MTTLREAAQQALAWIHYHRRAYAIDEPIEERNLRAALAQQEQEPVAWMTHTNDLLPLFHKNRKAALNWQTQPTPLYTAPPRREWHSLTDADFDSICDNHSTLQGAARAIEAKLKEKNT